MNLIQYVEDAHLRFDLPKLRAGQTIKVHTRIIEGTKERVQIFEGVVIRTRGSEIGKSFTVRKMSHGVGVERTFQLHSPRVLKIEVMSQGKVRRAKLYFLRERTGKKARLRRIDLPY
ncbi:MAG: 50S ribosomal protein L19 [Deltaproteobacteria bacterium]|nr:50S ribosomal protein L19 [Deltaproteobacteria bacterium]